MAKKTATPPAAPPGMPNLFAKAAAAPATDKGKKKTETVWRLSGESNKDQLALEGAITEFIANKRAESEAKTQKKRQADQLAAYSEGQFVAEFAAKGVSPETPMKLTNSKGESVTYVVQDKTATANITEEQVQAVEAILGEDGASKVILRQNVFSLNPEVLTPEKLEPVGAAISEALGKLVEKGVLKAEELGELIKHDARIRFIPGLVAQLGTVCGKDASRIEGMLEAMGSACPRYML